MAYNVAIECFTPLNFSSKQRISKRLRKNNIEIYELKEPNGYTSTDQLANEIVYGRRRICHNGIVNVASRILAEFSLDYSERFVLGIDYAFPFYYLGVRPYIRSIQAQTFQILRTRGLAPLSIKFYSGDVSGTIGEALFAYVATNIFGVNNLVHLRPQKQRGHLTPDFVVIGLSEIAKLSSLLCGRNPSSELLYVECKTTFSGTIERNRILKGLNQLIRVMERGSTGLLFIVHRRDGARSQSSIVIQVLGLIYI